MSEVYELQKRIDELILQVSTIKEIPIQPAIANVTNSITSTPDIVYGLSTLNAINETITTVNSIVVQLNLVLAALRGTLIIGE
ncbi:MAG TPA: hypothetical protein PKC11_14875 [Agitococcus sp.]|nr:hypothetical protein [Agitococcus sp.]